MFTKPLERAPFLAGLEKIESFSCSKTLYHRCPSVGRPRCKRYWLRIDSAVPSRSHSGLVDIDNDNRLHSDRA
eukprot:3769088-Heterocapsa_arctica.AAC.1